MDLEEFTSSLVKHSPPDDLTPALKALWLDNHNFWDAAHEMIQNESDKESALVHAYLHRKEGDEWNSRYWYSQAKEKPFSGSLEEEWRMLVNRILNQRRAA